MNHALKRCSGNYSNGQMEFTGTYVTELSQGSIKEYREGLWQFWHPNGSLRYEGVYKKGSLISKKCWTTSGELVACDLVITTALDKIRLLKA